MQKCIVGRKLGMTQLFDENGKFIPVTVVEAGPCVVVQKKTIENDGYEAVQIGFGEVTSKHVNKPLQLRECSAQNFTSWSTATSRAAIPNQM